MITYKIEKYPNDMQKSLKETPNYINRKKMKEVLSKTKKTMQREQIKKNILSNRLFWKFYRNQKLEDIYSLELEKEKPKPLQNFKLFDIKDKQSQSNILILM